MAPIPGVNRHKAEHLNPPLIQFRKPEPKPQASAIDPSKISHLSEMQQFAAAQRQRVQRTEIKSQAQLEAEQAQLDLKKEKAVDGNYLGAGGTTGQTFPPNTPLKDIPGVEPTGGVRNNETIIYTNGIQNNTEYQFKSMGQIAEQTGSRVIGVRNSTEGFTKDAVEVFSGRADRGKNPAVDTLGNTIYGEVAKGNPVHLMAHSQGGIITSQALTDVKERLMKEGGLSLAEAEQKMSNIKVETFGAAAKTYPDGPQYVHYIRKNDPVPQALGLGSRNSSDSPYPGRGAVIHEFTGTDAEGKDEPILLNIPHGFNDYYIKERVPFDQARQGKFNPPPKFEIGDLPRNAAIGFRNGVIEKLTPYVHQAEASIEWWRKIF